MRKGNCFCYTNDEGDTQVVNLDHVVYLRIEEGVGTNFPIDIRFCMTGSHFVDISVTREMAREILDDLQLRDVPVPADNDDAIAPKAWIAQ